MTLKSIKVLHVEDEDVQAFLIKTMLKIADCELYYRANSYESALAVFAECKPDIILMDVNLVGEKTGIDIVKELHKLYYLPVIFITGTEDNDKLEEIKSLPMCKLLGKTIKYDKLISEISDSLETFKNKEKFSLYSGLPTAKEETTVASLVPHSEKAIMFKSWFKSIL